VEFAAYVADEWAVTGSWKINAGLRFSGFTNDGTTYTRWEPRLASNYRVSDRMSIKASYARMHQYLHLVATTGASLPTDVWFPSTENVKPQRSDQVAAGFELLLGGDFFLTNEYYYKWLDNQLQFVDGAELFVNDNLEEEFAIGKGFAYGGELGIEKKEGKLTGWIGYTLALIRLGEFQTLDPNAVFGEGLNYFSPRYDRRHDLSIVAIYEINKRLTATATWVYGSGDLFWLPPGRFTFQDVQGLAV
jgi:outer membrane receptor protein involved in Fe transport